MVFWVVQMCDQNSDEKKRENNRFGTRSGRLREALWAPNTPGELVAPALLWQARLDMEKHAFFLRKTYDFQGSGVST